MTLKPTHVYTSPVGNEYLAAIVATQSGADRMGVKIFDSWNRSMGMQIFDWVTPNTLRPLTPEDAEKFLGLLL